MPRNFEIADFDQIDGVPCPCGIARRAFANPETSVASVHKVEISREAVAHYHKKMTEIYVVLSGAGEIELDGQRYPIRPMHTIQIKPGCRHRAIGELTILNIAVPAFDPGDEWFD